MTVRNYILFYIFGTRSSTQSERGVLKLKGKIIAGRVWFINLTYATQAAGGIIYSLSVLFLYFLARPYGLTIANIFIPSSLGGQKLLVD